MAETNGHSLEAIQRASHNATQPHQKILQSLKSKYGPNSQKATAQTSAPVAPSAPIELSPIPRATSSGRALSVGSVERRASINTARRPSGIPQPAYPLSSLGQAPAVFDEEEDEDDDLKPSDVKNSRL